MFKNGLKNLGRGWSSLAGSLLGERFDKVGPELSDGDCDLLRRQLRRWLEARGGEASARKHAVQAGELYLGLSATGRKQFLLLLAEEFGPDRNAIREQCQEYLASKDEACGPIEERLRDLLISPRLKLLRQFNLLPEGIKFLVDLRQDLLTFSREHEALVPLDREIKRLLATWFDVGLLEMRQIDWQSSAALLEKLVAYEAVHEIHSWQDLRHRLNMDRRCYAFFHPNMPDEPLIFVEVALTQGIAGSIQELLDETTPDVSPEDADTAIFYSISNAQQGLKGISFGNFLIKRVVESLKSELPNIKTFSTLSPVPGFTSWLQGQSQDTLAQRIGEQETTEIANLLQQHNLSTSIVDLAQQEGWHEVEPLRDLLQAALQKLLYDYLHTLRRDGQPIDPVERFHLGNGARVERINWLGDVSPKGLAQAFGFMINYLYPVKDIEKNHELYATRRKIVESSSVRSLKAKS